MDSGRSSQADPEDVARLAVQRGAQDYLLQDRIDGYSLPKALTGMLERSAFAEALFLEKERAQVTLNSIGDAVISIDVAGHVTYLNPVAESMTGRLRQEASGRPLQDVLRIIDGETREPALNPLAMAMLHNKSVSLSANCSGRRRQHFKAQGTSLSRPDRPNDLWCADYKGEFMLADRRYCYPLTVTDFATRYLLCCEALETTKERYAFTVFERTFKDFGLPRAIRSHNGVPFASNTAFFVIIVKVADKRTQSVVTALIKAVRKLPVALRRSLTWDRGSELASHAQFTVATDVQVYFCDPSSPWQRGSNENTNGLLRQYYPKGMDLSGVSQAQLDTVARKLNTDREKRCTGKPQRTYLARVFR